jgi:iron complex outermembrane recepter protein
MKGSNAILFGNVAAGGVLNLVTKKPKFENGGEISFRTGSYDLYKPTLDIYGAVSQSKHVAYRLNTSYQNAGSFRDHVSNERIYFNPSLLYKVNEKTNLLLEADYLKDNRTLDFGTAAIDYKIADLPRGTFLNTSWAYYQAQQNSVNLTLNHLLANQWNLRVTGSYQGFANEQFGAARPNSQSNFVQPDGKWIRTLQKSKTDQEYLLAQLDITGKIRTGSVEHNILIGADVDHYQNETPNFARVAYDSINVFDLSLYQQRSDIPSVGTNSFVENPISREGYYVQDHVSITSKVKLLAGLRYTKISSYTATDDYVKNTASKSRYYDEAFSPRVGVVFQPMKSLALFSSYSNSFSLNTATDSLKNPLPASIIDQYEAGAKYDVLDGLLSVNVTAYKIVNGNFAQPYVVVPKEVPNAQEISGEVTSKGLEVDLMSRSIFGFTVIAGYSYNDTRYTKTEFYKQGSRLRYNPSNTANASVYYNFDNGTLKGLNVGVLGFYMGDRVAGRSMSLRNQNYKLTPVDGYFQFDVSAGYTFSNVSLRIKVSNLLNELSYNVHDDNSVNPIAPRMFAATIGYKW